MKNRPNKSGIAVKIAAAYALFGFLWILLSDSLLLFLVRNHDTVNRLQTYKGWFYVLVTAALVYLMVQGYVRTQQQSEERYRRLLSNIADPIYLVDSEGRIIDYNHAAEKRLGFSHKDMQFTDLSGIDPNIDMVSWKTMIAESAPDETYLRESVHRSADGTDFPVEISACVFDEGNRRYVLGVVRDISERKQTLELLLQNEKMNSLGNMAAGIAHEINNPLSAILGACQNIQNRIFKDSPRNLAIAQEYGIDLDQIRSYMDKREITRMIGSIASGGERASRIVTSMLNFSYSGQPQLHTCSVPSLIDETIELISADFNLIKSYNFKSIEIIRDYPEKDLPICCISSAIQQVMLNLIKNATEAMAEKEYAEGENTQLTIRVRNESGTVIIEVEDNGPGIDLEEQKKIFDPFYTSKEVGQGTGLGLSISYFIITDQHNGSMEVESVKGSGTKFIITLPEDSCNCCPLPSRTQA